MGSRVHRPRISIEKLNKFMEAFQKGTSIKGCCAVAGINVKTFYNFLDDAEIDEETGKPKCKIAESFKFAMEVNSDRFETALLNEMLLQLKRDKRWQIAAWLLERKMPEKYGRVEARKAEKKQTQAKVVFENVDVEEGRIINDKEDERDDKEKQEDSEMQVLQQDHDTDVDEGEEEGEDAL